MGLYMLPIFLILSLTAITASILTISYYHYESLYDYCLYIYVHTFTDTFNLIGSTSCLMMDWRHLLPVPHQIRCGPCCHLIITLCVYNWVLRIYYIDHDTPCDILKCILYSIFRGLYMLPICLILSLNTITASMFICLCWQIDSTFETYL